MVIIHFIIISSKTQTITDIDLVNYYQLNNNNKDKNFIKKIQDTLKIYQKIKVFF